ACDLVQGDKVVSLLAKVVEHLVTCETMQMTTTSEQHCTTCLESLIFYCSDSPINFEALESQAVAATCSDLRGLRVFPAIHELNSLTIGKGVKLDRDLGIITEKEIELIIVESSSMGEVWGRKEPLTITTISAQIVMVPLGHLMASTITKHVFFKGTRWEFTMNPGPFNVKEHFLMTIFANSGAGTVYAPHIVTAIYAMELNGQELYDRELRLDYSRLRGSFNTLQSERQTHIRRDAKVLRFLFEVESTLQEHFASCGEVARVSLPKDYESGALKGNDTKRSYCRWPYPLGSLLSGCYSLAQHYSVLNNFLIFT
ncbi:hypothetical protein IFM89_021559, partial [Coptis chinensis]